MNNNTQLIQAANKALDNMANAYPVDERTKSIRDRADDVIDIIEDKYEFHACNLTKEEALDMSKLLKYLSEYL